MHIDYSATVTFKENSTVNLLDNGAYGNGGVMYIDDFITITFIVNFINNNANGNGGVMYIDHSTTVTFKGNSTVNLIDNGAYGNGGVMYVDYSSTITFEGNPIVNFIDNDANSSGGVVCFDHNSNLWIDKRARVVFNGNKAYLGGCVYMKFSSIIKRSSSVVFINNTALQNGGAIYLRDQSNFKLWEYSNVTFYYNSASGYGWAIYVLYDNWIHFFIMPNSKRILQG